jgi:hypothetical protein
MHFAMAALTRLGLAMPGCSLATQAFGLAFVEER